MGSKSLRNADIVLSSASIFFLTNRTKSFKDILYNKDPRMDLEVPLIQPFQNNFACCLSYHIFFFFLSRNIRKSKHLYQPDRHANLQNRGCVEYSQMLLNGLPKIPLVEFLFPILNETKQDVVGAVIFSID